MTFCAKLAAAATSLGLVIGVAAAPALAQQSGAPATGQPSAQAAPEFSDSRLDAVSAAMVEVEKIRVDYTARLQATEDPDERAALMREAGQAMGAEVEAAPNVTVEEYNEVLAAASNNPTLAREIQDRMQAKRD